jgi:NAD(P)H-hydrate epimerase
MSDVLTREETRGFDRWAIETVGIPALVLMENAGRGAADVLKAHWAGGSVLIACGKGNNGGDGLVIARHLANWGVPVEVVLFAHPLDLSAEAAIHWRITQNLGIKAEACLDVAPNENYLITRFANVAWIVDALFGTGLTGPVREPSDRVIAAINASPAKVLAVDIPSGLDADTGTPLGPTVRAHHTATFIAPKVGYRNPAAAAWLGQVHVVDIGVAVTGWPRPTAG